MVNVEFPWTKGQLEAMEMAEKMMKTRTPIMGVLAGFAGTGKTTLLKHIASTYGEPLVLTPTGKAALRVREATGLRASTIHRWLYHVGENITTGEMEFKRKEKNLIEQPQNRLIVIDEASMVGRDLWEDVWDVCQILGMRILLVGDTFQLAPIEAPNQKPFSVLKDVETPFRVLLTEVTRQALDNPVLRASMIIRESNFINPALQLLTRVWGKDFDDKCMETYQAGGAIIVHKNDTRHRINAMIRERLGYGPQIQPEEPLLVLRNTYEIDRFNGEIVRFNAWDRPPVRENLVEDRYNDIKHRMGFGVAFVDKQMVLMSPEQIRGDSAKMSENVIARASKREFFDTHATDAESKPIDGDSKPLAYPHLHANFGYALTCHKSQGSEWNQVLVLIESSTRYTSYEGRRWLYTAITRAREKASFSIGASI